MSHSMAIAFKVCFIPSIMTHAHVEDAHWAATNDWLRTIHNGSALHPTAASASFIVYLAITHVHA